MSESNVNLSGNVPHEVNVKRLGSQQKAILRHLYENDSSVFQQVELIESLQGEVTDSRKASVSRSISKLQEHDLVFERKKVLITPEDTPLISEPYYSRHRVRFGITELGERFVETDSRFPEFGGSDDD